MRKLIVLGIALALSASASAQVVNKATLYSTNAKGSLLVLADIDISGQKDTLVRMVNDGDTAVAVKCMWLTWEKARADFVITLTPHQPVIFDAVDGNGSITVNPFPTENPAGAGVGSGAGTVPNSNYGIGELKCWAVGLNDQQIVHNHLSANATVIDFAAGTAYQYAAAAFYNRTTTDAGKLILDGANYDKCPQYLIGQFSPVQDPEGIDTSKGNFTVLSNRLAIANCRQDLRQDWIPHITKLQFDVFNGFETKFTGSWECADSFHVTYLGANTNLTAKPPIPLVRWAVPGNFRYSTLGTKAAYFRVEGVKSTQCDNVTIWGTGFKSEATGLIGVLSSVTTVEGQPAAVAVTLTGAGTSKGQGLIEFDPGTTPGGTPEARR